MAVVPNNLMLSEKQIEVLTEMGISVDAIYIVKGESLHSSAVRIDGYTNGHYVFFLEGDAEQHSVFLRYLFGENHKIIIPTRFRSVSLYGSPTQKYVKPENLVAVQTSTVAPISYSG